jgi:hypothetical protein
MKTKTLSIFFFIFSLIGQTQNNDLELSELTESEYAKLLNNQFSQTVTGQSNNSLGNFASVDIVNSTVEFAPSIFFSNGNILTAEIKAGISDGTSSIFSNSKLNSNIGAKINYHFLFQNNNSISIRNIKNTKLLEKRINEQREKDIKSIEKGEKIKSIEYEVSKLESELTVNQALITNESHSNLRIQSYELKKKILQEEINQKRQKIKLLPMDQQRDFKVNKLNGEINQKLFEIKDLNAKILKESQSPARIAQAKHKNEIAQKKIDSLNKYKAEFDSKFEKFLIYEKYREKAKELIDKYKVIGIEMTWFSAFYEVNSNNFKRVNSESDFDNQIVKEDFVSHGFGVQLSWLKLNSIEQFKSFFWSNGLNFSYSDNFSDLTKQEITETNELGTNPGQRSITSKFNAYSGEYNDHNRSLNLYSDFYYFMFHNNQAAIHINPTYRVIEDTKPRFNFSVGLVFSFKNSKKEDKAPIINAEVYYNFLDLFKTTETDYKLFERNDIGLRFTFPINFNIKS